MANLKLTAEKLVKEKASVKTDLEMAVKWGCDLQSEHERYLTEEAFSGCPVIVRDYPKVRELIGGSQREERLEYFRKLVG
ncbi:asparagine--tRNA ligase, chloroplastic/mitochondrial isoform X2 [Rosa chinensis]|uniref:asparagine--tRNA ligase, chloroplastic/mitochondrial isoform X2 n=1 Tax=Rosa chinensis TaxID=74649 RepID=UPI000D09150A|nr:asparagine--tRNA ligase, chloroplastic/mitochondrial isoform X2 [Rosa chinensis]XP_024175394.1 asparagine--tRNA ligase, chloroplastic/mitochondrial isoform X2 [Rosa chinensis]